MDIKLSFILQSYQRDVISTESPRQTAGDTTAYAARESQISETEGVLNTLRNGVATVTKFESRNTTMRRITTANKCEIKKYI